MVLPLIMDPDPFLANGDCVGGQDGVPSTGGRVVTGGPLAGASVGASVVDERVGATVVDGVVGAAVVGPWERAGHT